MTGSAMFSCALWKLPEDITEQFFVSTYFTERFVYMIKSLFAGSFSNISMD